MQLEPVPHTWTVCNEVRIISRGCDPERSCGFLTVAEGIQKRLYDESDTLVFRRPGWHLSLIGASSVRDYEFVLANIVVDIDDMARWTIHCGDRGPPVSRLEHAARAARRMFCSADDGVAF